MLAIQKKNLMELKVEPKKYIKIELEYRMEEKIRIESI